MRIRLQTRLQMRMRLQTRLQKNSSGLLRPIADTGIDQIALQEFIGNSDNPESARRTADAHGIHNTTGERSVPTVHSIQ